MTLKVCKNPYSPFGLSYRNIMKILIIIDQFSIGGAARVVSRLLDGFCGSGHKVILATKDEDRTKMYPIPLGVEVVYFEPVSVQRNHSIFDSLSMHRK